MNIINIKDHLTNKFKFENKDDHIANKIFSESQLLAITSICNIIINKINASDIYYNLNKDTILLLEDINDIIKNNLDVSLDNELNIFIDDSNKLIDHITNENGIYYNKLINFNNNVPSGTNVNVIHYLNNIKNEIDLKKINFLITENFTEEYNFNILLYIINKSLFTNHYKQTYIHHNNITFLLKNQFPNLNSITQQDIDDYYNNYLFIDTNDVKPVLITFNSNNYIIFENLLYYNDIINNYLISSDEILIILNLIKNSNNKVQLQEITELQNNLPNYFYNYISNNNNIEDIDVNTIIKNNSVGEQKYYFYKNCILTKSEYELIKLDNFEYIIINKVDTYGRIIEWTSPAILFSNVSLRQDYSTVNKFCLSYSNGINAYGTLELDNNGYIYNLKFEDYGLNFIEGEYAIIDIYDIPNTLTYISNSSFKYIKRKTDLPFNIKYNYENDTISSKINIEYYYYLNEILYNLDYNYLYNKNDVLQSAFFNSTGTINSITKYINNDNEINIDITNNNLLLKFNEKPPFNFIEITNSLYYNGIYLLISTINNNEYVIIKNYISDETNIIYNTGLNVIYNNTNFNTILDYKYINICQTTNKFRFLNAINNNKRSNTKKNISDYNNDINTYLLNNIVNLNQNKIDIYNKYINFDQNLKNIGFPFNENDNNYYIIKQNLINFNNIFNYSLQNYNYNSEINRLQNIIIELINNETLLINLYLNIEDELNNPDLNNYIFKKASKSSWINNIGYNILDFCDLYINNIKIQSITREYFYINSNLTINNIDKYNKLLGINDELTTFSSNIKPNFTLYLQIPFWFNNYKNTFFPLYLLNNSEIKLKYKINNLNNLIKIENNSNIMNLSIDVTAIIDTIHLQNNNLTYNNEILYEDLQILQKKINTTNKILNIKLNYYSSIKEIIFTISENNTYNKYININNIIDKIELLYENIIIKKYLCEEINCLNILKQGYIYNNTNINLIPFNLYNIFNPSGSLNFSVLKNIYLKFYFKDSINKNYILTVYGKTYNILKTLSGMGNKLFNN